MTRTHRIVPILTALSIFALDPANATVAAPRLPAKLDPAVLSGPSPRAIVMFDHNVTGPTIERLANAGVTHARVFDAIDAVAVDGPRSVYPVLARWDDVRWVEDDSVLELRNHVAKSDTGVNDVRAGISPLTGPYSGKGVTVAVLDTGVDSQHPDLAGRFAAHLYMEPAAILDPITDGSYSERDAEIPTSTDEYGHGTHVSGIIGGSGRAAMGADMSGVAPGTTMLNCKLGIGLNVESMFETNALACFQWILDHRRDDRFPGGIRVISNSWGFSDELTGERPLELMIRALVEEEIVVVFAAGNTGEPDADDPSTTDTYPSGMEEVITVGATCKSEGNPTIAWSYCDPLEVASWSSRGPEIDLVAPGVDIWSTKSSIGAGVIDWSADGTEGHPGLGDPVAMANNHAWYIAISGTSMSAPHVAGIVALMLDANPDLDPATVEQILTSTARDFGAPGFDNDYGFGFVDAVAAVAASEALPGGGE